MENTPINRNQFPPLKGDRGMIHREGCSCKDTLSAASPWQGCQRLKREDILNVINRSQRSSPSPPIASDWERNEN